MKGIIVGAALAVALLTGCGSAQAPEPVGIGSERHELKRSPCGCFEIRRPASVDA
ncbi:MAG TPA: hypothetical protein HPQ04_10940 [Rhodospirillaceae bacterium]|nr:hypothetical protein [Rhodospirillaceae bacterium]